MRELRHRADARGLGRRLHSRHASGGAGRLEHFYEALTDGGASAVLAASLFHFGEFTIGDVKPTCAEGSCGNDLEAEDVRFESAG